MVSEKLMELRVVTGKVRFHYVNLFAPRESLEGYAPKFGLCVLISKDDLETIDKINMAIEKAMMSGEELWEGEALENLKVPLRDGDVERPDRPEFAGHYFINAASKYMPEIVDENCFEITNPEEVYSGCYGRVSVKFFPYNKVGNLGIGCGLDNVQKLEDGELLVTRISAEEDFAEVDDILR